MSIRSAHVSPAVALLAAWVAIIAGGSAQEKPPVPAAPAGAVAPLPEETEVLALGAKELDGYAALCFKNGFPKRAREVWLEVIGEYAADDEAARKALGFYRHGEVWQRDGKFEYPEHEELNVAVARMLESRWGPLAQRLGEAHRALAAQLATAGKPERSSYHVQRALRFLPEDAKVKATAGLGQLEGIIGSPLDLEILRRSRLMDRAITRLTEQQFASSVVEDKNPILDKGGMPYVTVKSDNFLVYGDWEPAVLQQAAAWAERSLLFCGEAFAGYDGFPSRGPQTRKFAFFQKKETWIGLVRANESVIGKDQVEFTVQNTASQMIKDVQTCGAEQVDSVYDYAVRRVAQGYCGVGCDALQEGLGHAVVGMFFGRNLWFSVGQQKKEGTVAGKREEQKLLLPDMETWKELATELAWAKTGTPAARLPLLKAAQFPTDGRIKAWSFCDYLLRADPVLLRQLDRTAAKARTENDVLGLFQEYAGQPLQHVEDRWRRFWTEDGALKQAILQKSTPLEAASKEAPAWLEQFNNARKALGGAPVGWSSQLSTDCKQHVDYLKANKDLRGPEHEHTQVAGKPGFSNAGRTFAQQAVVWTRDKEPKKAIETWLLLPGFRDALLNRNIDTAGIYAEGGIVVLDAVRGRAPSDSATTAIYPVANQGARAKDPVPGAVDVELLGPEVKNLLRKNQREKQKQIGLPLSLHLYHAAKDGVTCAVTAQGAPVPGWLVKGDGTIRRTSAQGLWVFYPEEPLKRGVDIKVSWTWPGGKADVTFIAN